MASLVLNQNILNNQAKPSLDQAKRYLNQARSKCNSLSIPTSFLYRNYLKNIANSLLNIEIDINASKTKIDDTLAQYNGVESKTSNKVRSLTAMVGNVTANIGATVVSNTPDSVKEKVNDLGKTAAKVGKTIAGWAKGAWGWATDKVSDIKKTAAKVGKSISAFAKKTENWTSKAIDDVKKTAKKTLKVLEKVCATVVVGFTTICSGVLKIAEGITDGAVWLGGVVVSGVAELFGADEFADNAQEFVMDFTKKNLVGEVNKIFYEKTSIGKKINEDSYLKYNSEIAKKIQNITTDVTIIVAATAVSVVCPAAAPIVLFAAGALYGAGRSAEEHFQDEENRSFWKDSIAIGVDGVVEGFNTMLKGKGGKAFFEGAKMLCSKAGLKAVVGVAKSIFTKEGAKNTLTNLTKGLFRKTGKTFVDTFTEIDIYADTAGLWADDIKTGLETGEWDIKAMVSDLTYSFGVNYLSNFVANELQGVIKADVDAKKADLNSEHIIDSDIAKKYKNADELYQAYISGKTKMNTKEYAEAMDFFKVRDKISLKNKTGMALEELFSDDDYIIGVHRAGNGNAQSILDNGLYLTGHSSSGGFTSSVDLKNNITFHDDYFGFVKALSEGSSYKTGGVGFGDAVIVKIPKSDIKNFDKILDFSNTTPVLKSDYLVGSISSYIDSNGKVLLGDISFNNKMFDSLSNYKAAVINAKGSIGEIDTKLVKEYEAASQTGKTSSHFMGYEEHNFVHVKRVADESLDIGKKLNESIKSGQLKNLDILDENILYKSGLAHDLGMKDGGYVIFKDGSFTTIDNIINNLDNYESKIKSLLKIDESVSLSSVEDVKGKLIRTSHPLNSAITVLQNDDIFGTDAEIIACLDFLHSKSSSGVKDITSTEQLSDMVKKLYDNQVLNSKQLYKFDISKLVECDASGIPILENGCYKFKNGIENQLKTGSIALRVGDAHAVKTGFNHGGGQIIVETVPDSKVTLEKYFGEVTKFDDLCDVEASKSNIKIKYDDEIKSLSGGDYDYSKRIVIGEKNAVTLPVEVGNNSITYTHKVKSTNSPACTWKYGIEEKFGEYSTFSNTGIKQNVIIELPNDSSDSLLDFYQEQAVAYMNSNNSENNQWINIIVKKGAN